MTPDVFLTYWSRLLVRHFFGPQKDPVIWRHMGGGGGVVGIASLPVAEYSKRVIGRPTGAWVHPHKWI